MDNPPISVMHWSAAPPFFTTTDRPSIATISCVTVMSESRHLKVKPSSPASASDDFQSLLISPMCTESESVLHTLDAPAPDPPPATVTV